MLHLAGHYRGRYAFLVEDLDQPRQLPQREPVNRNSIVHRGAVIDLRIGLFANRRYRHRKPLRPRRVQQQKWEPPVTRNEPELHRYLMIPRWLRSMNEARIFTSSPSISRIFSTAAEVFIFDVSSSRNAFCSVFKRSGVNPRRVSPTLLMPNALFSRRDEVSENGSTSCVTIVPPPINAYCPTEQNWCTGLKAPTLAWSSIITCPASVAELARMQWLPTWLSCPMCTYAISRHPDPTRVMPPPFSVPRLIVTHSRIVFSSPISVSVGSPLYFKSCGATPIDVNGCTRFRAPIRVRPSTT